MDVEDWLRGLGLERYEQAFRDHEIDADLLPNLTADDLKDLGVALVGHRRRLLDAIARLRDASPGSEAAAADRAIDSSSASVEPGVDHGSRPPLHPEAERRQLTVMFVDLVGSTALSARLDPEDMRAVIGSYQKVCGEVIGRYDGHVAKYMGDGVLAYFGWPRAHEDDAERAVRAGLELAAAIGRQNAEGVALAVRIGIATGQVVVGDLIGEGAAQEEAVVGETPNLAARLQALAEPGGVVIGPGTRRLVGGLFELTDLGDHELRGFGVKIQAWQVVGTGRAESRFAARSASGLTPFVGREHELGMLVDRFEQAREGEGQVVLLSGEPGIGKSRLVHALIERLAEAPHTRMRYYCSPYHVNSALHPIIEQLERAAAFEPDDPPERNLDKLEALLGQGTNDPAAVAPLIAALLSIPVGTRYPPLNLAAQRQRELTIAVLLDQLSGLAAQRPVVMVLEDGHWLDPSSTELFERVIERVQTLPVLLLVTFRPEFQPPWTSYPHMTSLTLNRLGRRHSTEMIAAVAGGKPLPEEVLAQIWAKTEGVPLFVEELTKTVLESGLLEDRGDRFALTGPLPPLAIPATLQDSLMARLDRLAPVKEVAQIGAVIGREFSYRLLAALSPLDETALQEALSHLVGSELVFRRGTIPEAIYSFKHAFVQDAAYASLLKSRRQQLHARIAAVLEEHFPGTVLGRPEVVARHWTEAGIFAKAVVYWERAGQQANARSAAHEAAAQFTKALELLATLAQTGERKREELRLQTALGGALIAAKGLAALEASSAYARAHELCLELGDDPLLISALLGQYWIHSQRGELGKALEVAEEVLSLAERQADTAPRIIGHRIIGTSLFHIGRLTSAREHLEAALALYDPAKHASLASLYTFDPSVAGLSFLSWLLYALGYPEQALQRSQEALGIARRLGHLHTLAHALAHACICQQLCRNRQAVEEQYGALFPLATEQGFRFWLAVGAILRGWAAAEAEQAEAGIAQIRHGLNEYQAMGAELWSPYFLALLGEAHGRANQPAIALDLLANAIERVERTGGRWFEAELHRFSGELRSLRSDDSRVEAEACFRQAIAVARKQGAKMWELRAATSLARLWAEQGERQRAYDLLAPVYGWFTEGFETQDLKDAKALLEALR